MRKSCGDAAPEGGRVTAYVLFGSNLGDRRRSIEEGLAFLERGGVVWSARSSFYETEPVGVDDQPWFLNLAARGSVSISPRALLTLCKAAEEAAGRTSGIRFGPRTLDADILLFGEVELDLPDLVIPHPRLRERRFALVPLLEVAPDLRDFRDGQRYDAVLQRLDEGKKVAKSTTKGS